MPWSRDDEDIFFELKGRFPPIEHAAIAHDAKVRGLSMNRAMRRLLNIGLREEAARAELGDMNYVFLKLLIILARSAAGASNYLINPAVYAAVERAIVQFLAAFRPDVPVVTVAKAHAEEIETAQRERRAIPPAIALLGEIGDTDGSAFVAEWRRGIREDLGPETAARVVELRKATLAAVAALREAGSGEPPAHNPAVQSSWGDAINAVKDEGVEGEIETIRQQIPRLRRQHVDGHLDQRSFADKVMFLKRQIVEMRGIDKVTRDELLSQLDALTANTAPGDAS